MIYSPLYVKIPGLPWVKRLLYTLADAADGGINREFNAPNLYIIYYCNNVNSDTTLYDYVNLYLISGLVFDSSNNIQIVDWLITGYLAPSISTLTFLQMFRRLLMKLETSNIKMPILLRVVLIHRWLVMLCTTLQKLQYYDGLTSVVNVVMIYRIDYFLINRFVCKQFTSISLGYSASSNCLCWSFFSRIL